MSILTGALAIIGLLLGALIYLIPGLLAGAGEKLGLHRLAAAVWRGRGWGCPRLRPLTSAGRVKRLQPWERHGVCGPRSASMHGIVP